MYLVYSMVTTLRYSLLRRVTRSVRLVSLVDAFANRYPLCRGVYGSRSITSRPTTIATTAIAGNRCLSLSQQCNMSTLTTPLRQEHGSPFQNMLGDTPPPEIVIGKALDQGFILWKHGDASQKITVAGPLIVASGEAWNWQLDLTSDTTLDVATWSEQVLRVIRAVEPRPELLVLGTGRQLRNITPSSQNALKELGVSVEHLSTDQASMTFNILAEEGRDVMAMLLPKTV
ncbi:hypothetical protein BDF22DRAFT_675769 [Syncephalis plumigaleata]|nr:hypothetical protein BDF22DRAFT_675769 [Syncephalis plumigaleata]